MITGTKAGLLLAASSEERKNYQDEKITLGAVYFFFNFLLIPGNRDSFILMKQIFILSLDGILLSQCAITCAYKDVIITGKMIKCFKTNNLNQQERK